MEDRPGSSLDGEGRLVVVMVDSHRSIERGGAVQCVALARTLARRGHAVTCFFDGVPGSSASGPEFEGLAQAGVDVRFERLWSPVSMARFRHWLRAEGPDVVHTHKNRALRFVYLALLGLRRRPWVANRGTVYSLGRHPFAAWIHRHCVDRVLAVSEAVRDVLLDDGIAAERARVVYGSVDPKAFDPSVSGAAMRKRWGMPPGAQVVGMLASLDAPKKGHADLLAAGAQLQRHSREVRLVFAGEGDASALRAKARELGIADRVSFVGFVREVPEALAAFDVLVCASLRGEGLTGAVREALAMERPVVSTTGAGNSELVIHGETGLLTPPGEPQLLARAVAELLEDPDRARAMARAGRTRVLELCTDAVRADRVEEIYRELLRA